ncbi:MAG: ATP-binding protein [candidate division KSB1 bacterium]|nr:ATP-binding protein [candidate division KSB1 bacterium]
MISLGAGEVVKHHELEWPIDDDSKAFLEFNAAPIYENDKIMGYQAIARDISERRKLQMQLADSQKMEAIGELAGGIAHDFNNLLTVINGNTEMALLRNQGNEKLEKNLNVVLNAGKRAASLTAQLLAFGRRQMLQNELTDVSALLQNISTVIERSVGENIDVELDLDKDLDLANIDPSQFEQAVMNMILNARDAMPEGGKVALQTENINISKDHPLEPFEDKDGEFVKITIADTGPGMDDETRRKIFEPFYTTKKQGTGLGLSTVYGTIMQSKGDIAVKSDPGKGTVFTILFPAGCQKRTGGSSQ